MPHLYLSHADLDLLTISLALASGATEAMGKGEAIERLSATLAKVRKGPDARDLAIIEVARDQHEESGSVEIDGPDDGAAIVSEGDGNGAYVLAWVWADFAGTDLDKEADDTPEFPEDDAA